MCNHNGSAVAGAGGTISSGISGAVSGATAHSTVAVAGGSATPKRKLRLFAVAVTITSGNSLSVLPYYYRANSEQEAKEGVLCLLHERFSNIPDRKFSMSLLEIPEGAILAAGYSAQPI